MILKKVNMIFLQFVVLGTLVYANSCPKWFPMPSNNGLVVVLPIYDETIIEPDMDCDGIIDTIDTDIDGDGVSNSKDTFPLNSSESVDTDGDGIGNNTDSDDDNDGTIDSEDSNPLVNEIPIAHAGDDQRTDANVTVTLDASTSSDDGNILTYSWVLTDKPEGSSAVLNNSTVATPTFYADKVGTYRLELIVSDGILTSTKDMVFVNVGRESMLIAYDDGIHGKEPWITDGTPEGTHLLKDINIKNESSDIANMVDAGDVIYFSIKGNELWKSDGTDDGTIRIKKFDNYNLSKFTLVDDILYFLDSSYKLWKSDGTKIGTTIVDGNYWRINNLISFNNTLYISIYVDFEGQLWKINNVNDDLVMVASTENLPNNYTIVNNTLYFTTSNYEAKTKLWKSDGTQSGTKFIKEFDSADFDTSYTSKVSNLIELHNTLYFTANDGIHGNELWKSDGDQNSTIMVKDIFNGSFSSSPSNLIALDSNIYFTIKNGGYSQLWKTDGTEDGTVIVYEFNNNNPKNFIMMNNILYFYISDTLWRSDGSSLGTYSIKNNLYRLNNLIAVNNTLYFSANTYENSKQLWKSNGLVDGTIIVKEINNDFYTSDPTQFIGFNNMLYFSGDDNLNGSELWKSDGSEVGTSMLKNISTITYSSIEYNYDLFVKVGSDYYFVSNNNINGKTLWKSDGTEEGTVIVKLSTYDISNLVSMNNTLYFILNDMSGNNIWKSDGTEEGTVLLTSKNTSYPKNLIVMNNTLLFTTSDELWKSDGTNLGTVKIINIEEELDSFTIVNNNLLYFTVVNTNYTMSLWRSDGTKEGTYAVKNGVPIGHLLEYNNILYFSASGDELWKSDGTILGTILVKNLESYFSKLTLVDNTLYFKLYPEYSENAELWKSDGTPFGTSIVHKYNFYDIGELTVLNDTLYYQGDNKLWKYNSTDTAPSIVYSVDYNSYININKALNGELIFNIRTNNAYKLWKTNETETIQLSPIDNQL